MKQLPIHLLPMLTGNQLSTWAGLQSLTYKVGDTFYVKYHSSAHDLYLGASACDFKTGEQIGLLTYMLLHGMPGLCCFVMQAMPRKVPHMLCLSTCAPPEISI